MASGALVCDVLDPQFMGVVVECPAVDEHDAEWPQLACVWWPDLQAHELLACELLPSLA